MAQSYTTIPTYATGAKLAVADWNNVATDLNNGLTTHTTKGTYSSTGNNGTAPFFVYTAVLDLNTPTSGPATGLVGFSIPSGGFPNGVIMVQTTTTAYMADGTTSQYGHLCHPDYANCTKSQIYMVAVSDNGTPIANNKTIRVNVMVVGY